MNGMRVVSAALAMVLTLAAHAQSQQAINDYVFGLQYDTRQLLSLPTTTSTVELPPGRQPSRNGIIVCTNTPGRADDPLTRVMIFTTNGGTVFPGALVLMNQDLALGRPQAIGVARAPLTLSIDLPGLGDDSIMHIADPSQASVRAALNGVLEIWNRKPASQGYVNASRSDLTARQAFSRDQLALQLGFNAQWATGEALSRMDVRNTTQSSTSVALFRQVFYTVSMNTPLSPADVFADSVTLGDVQARASGTNPPAYVSSVDYGRLIMVRMETQSTETQADVEAALQWAASARRGIQADAQSRFERIIQSSSFTVVALGGNAADAATVLGRDALTELPNVIRRNAVYRRDNPGLPIGYTVHALRDNEHATFRFATEFTRTECQQFPNASVRLRHAGAFVARWEVTWRVTGSEETQTWESGNTTAGWVQTVDLPGDAHDVRIRAWSHTGLPGAQAWREALNVTEPGPTQRTYRITGTTLNPSGEAVSE